MENTSSPTLFSPEPPATVGGGVQDDDSLLYRRPDGISDREWDALKADTRDYIEWLIEKASRQR